MLEISKEELERDFYYEDGHLIRKSTNLRTGYIHSEGYIGCKWKGKSRKVHRLIFILHHGPTTNCIDHIDGDRKNNRIENLRAATVQENNRNQRKRKGTSSKFKGVSWNKYTRKWQASISLDGMMLYLGSFGSESEAAKVYDEKAKEVFGVYYQPNNP